MKILFTLCRLVSQIGSCQASICVVEKGEHYSCSEVGTQAFKSYRSGASLGAEGENKTVFPVSEMEWSNFPGRTEKPTNAVIHIHKCTQHDRLVGKTRLCKASPDFPTPLDVSLATEVDFLLRKKGGEGVCVCVCVCDFWRVLFYRVCPQMRCGGGCLANCGAISSRRIPVNEGRLPASPQPASGSPPHNARVTEQVIKALKAMTQHFSLHLISSKCSAYRPLLLVSAHTPSLPPLLLLLSPHTTTPFFPCLCSRLNSFLPTSSGHFSNLQHRCLFAFLYAPSPLRKYQ